MIQEVSTRTGTPPTENTFHVLPENIIRAYRRRGQRLAVASVAMNEDLRRALTFENRIREGRTTRTEPFEWGIALLNSDLPRVWDLNYLRADKALPSATAESLIQEAERLLGDAGYTHRQIDVYDEQEALRIAPGFLAAGWEALRAVFMVLRREPDRRAGIAAEQVLWRELRPTVEEEIRLDPLVTTEEVVQQLLGLHSLDADATYRRHFGARVGGRVVSHCDLYSDGETAQVEDVATLMEFRNRGLARAVIQEAVGTALGEGHDFVFIVADEDDWPKALYARLGNDAVGTLYTFRRTPAEG